MAHTDDFEQRLEAIEKAIFGRTGKRWHETGVLSDGQAYGKMGSMTHLINAETQRAISPGYHEFLPQGCGRYLVRTGATRCEYSIDGGEDWRRDRDTLRSLEEYLRKELENKP